MSALLALVATVLTSFLPILRHDDYIHSSFPIFLGTVDSSFLPLDSRKQMLRW
jgi:hypothetical protein